MKEIKGFYHQKKFPTKDTLHKVEDYLKRGEVALPPPVLSPRPKKEGPEKQTTVVEEKAEETGNDPDKSTKAAYAARGLCERLKDIPSAKVYPVIVELERLFQEVKQAKDPLAVERLTLLKAALQIYAVGEDQEKNWHDILLGFTQDAVQRMHGLYSAAPFIVADNAQKNYWTSSFAKGQSASEKHNNASIPQSGTLMGNHYCSAFPARGETSHLLLDGFHTTYVTDKNGQEMILGAIADGAGGHMDAAQDKAIARIAKYTCRYAVNAMAAYINKIKKETFDPWEKIMDQVSDVIKSKTPGFMESTSFLCYVAYPVEKGYRLQALSIGDVMLCSFHPTTCAFTTLVPAIRSGWGPALFPGDRTDKHWTYDLEAGNVLLGMTDGMYEELPGLQKNDILERDGKKYQELSLSGKEIAGLLEGKSSMEEIASTLKEAVVAAVRRKALNALEAKEERWRMGDDFVLTLQEIPTEKAASGAEKGLKGRKEASLVPLGKHGHSLSQGVMRHER